MVISSVIRGRFRHSNRKPVVRVAVAVQGHQSLFVDAILDTGAEMNIIEMSSAATMMGMTPSQIQQGRHINLGGLGNSAQPAWGWQVDLHLCPDSLSQVNMVLPSAWIYVTARTVANYPVLIGQFDGLQEKIFKHHNRSQNRFWELRK